MDRRLSPKRRARLKLQGQYTILAATSWRSPARTSGRIEARRTGPSTVLQLECAGARPRCLHEVTGAPALGCGRAFSQSGAV